jgi:molybdopterin/thiamine biosynthesis adenylyltransferase
MLDQPTLQTDQEITILKLNTAIINKWPSTTILSVEALKSRFPGGNFFYGWRFSAGDLGIDRNLLLVLPKFFPYTLPKAAFEIIPHIAEFPHVEADGIFCLESSDSLMVMPADIRHIESVIKDAVNVLRDGLLGINRQDFLDEIFSYWTLGQLYYKEIRLFVQKHNLSRIIRITELKDAFFAADNDTILHECVDSIYPKQFKLKSNRAAFIYLSNPIYPENYPTKISEIRNLIASAGESAVELFSSILEFDKSINVILGFKHNNENVLLGVQFQINKRNINKKFWKGFRGPEKIPKELLLSKISGEKFPLNRSQVVRIDSPALLRRTAGVAGLLLESVHVAVVGCGALGGTVTRLLAQSGIKNFTLFDGEKFEWKNVGRHELSGTYVGINKADAMKADILARFPDYKIIAYSKNYEQILIENPDLFSQNNLIISLTGNWQSDYYLNRLVKKKLNMPPVVFGFVEAHALAGHSLAIIPGLNTGCLQCLHNSLGEFNRFVAEIPKEHGLVKENACAGFYQPFSSLGVMTVAAMIGKTALDLAQGKINVSEHRVWVASSQEFDIVNAQVKHEWFEKMNKDGFERMYRVPLQPITNCSVCKEY